MNESLFLKCKQLGYDIRRTILMSSFQLGKKGVHIGPALSVSDILATLYGGVMNISSTNICNPNRDRFILSKGHAYMALYAVLNQIGVISSDEISANLLTDGGFLPAHPIQNAEKGIEFTGGSLGTGISYALGKALYAKMESKNFRVFSLLGDGECNEGSVWESIMFAAHKRLSNLTLIIDRNSLQQDGLTKDVLSVDLVKVVTGFGLNVKEVNGHDIGALYDALSTNESDMPMCIIANTIKGKGVPFMENDNYWHHTFLTEKQYNEAMASLT